MPRPPPPTHTCSTIHTYPFQLCGPESRALDPGVQLHLGRGQGTTQLALEEQSPGEGAGGQGGQPLSVLGEREGGDARVCGGRMVKML